MKKTSIVASTAISGLLALGLAGNAFAEDAAAKDKCYGVAKAGQNDCAANGHSCQGQAKTDSDPSEWKYVAKGSCGDMGGSLEAGKQPS
jgi:uncharacterized membrane protein